MNELYHYGVSKLDGSPGRGSGRYPLGSGKRPRSQNNKTVFISGSSKTQSKDSGYYRPLPKEIRNKIDGYIENGHKIIVGDAPGVDRQVQNYLNKKGYDNVEVYGPGKEVRYTANKKWKTNPIDAPEFEPNSKEWLAKKDIAMNDAADIGLAIVLDEGAKATRNNVKRLRDANKEVEVYELSKNGKANDKWIEDEIMSNTYLKHYGVSKMDGAPGRGSGRYPLGSGEEPKALSNKVKTAHSANTSPYGKHLVDQYVKDVNDSTKLSGKEKVATVLAPALIAAGLTTLGAIAGLPVRMLSPVLAVPAIQFQSAYKAGKAAKVTKKYEQEYGKDFIRKSIDAENERKKRFDEYTRNTH